MEKWLNKKEFELEFKPFEKSDTQIPHPSVSFYFFI